MVGMSGGRQRQTVPGHGTKRRSPRRRAGLIAQAHSHAGAAARHPHSHRARACSRSKRGSIWLGLAPLAVARSRDSDGGKRRWDARACTHVTQMQAIGDRRYIRVPPYGRLNKCLVTTLSKHRTCLPHRPSFPFSFAFPLSFPLSISEIRV